MKSFVRCLSLTLAVAAVLYGSRSAESQNTAFPGAYGFGANATGGRGGTVYHVTNLNDSGSGSFRDAVSSGNRIIVFDVGGYIVLNSPVSVSSNLTIAGQTAPGSGIGVMGAEVSLSNHTNIIIRNFRFRQGTLDPNTGKSALNMGNGSNIILDHCSFEYGQWDTVDAVGTQNFTVQNSIIANPIGQQFGAHVETGPSTFYRNLWVNAHNRQPLSKDNTQYINNVIYDYQLGYTSGNTAGYFNHDIVNNYFIAGPATTTPVDAFFQMDNRQSVYAVGNFLDSNVDGALNGSPDNTVGVSLVLSTPWAATTESIPTLSAADAYNSVVQSSGAFPRDQVDTFVVHDVNSLGTTGQLYKDQAVTGLPNDGYGNLPSGSPFPNTSGDGIADYWASANGLSTTDPSVGNAMYGNTGYMNLEVYLNSLVLPAPWSAADFAGTPLQGATSYNPFTDQWLLLGSGGGSNALDSGQFASQSWSSDGNLTAELLTSPASGAGSEAGIMLRDPASSQTAFVALVANGSGGVSFLWRNSDGQPASGIQRSNVAAPLWLRLVRKAGTVAGYFSADGANWTLLGLASPALPSMLQAGLVVASGSGGVLGSASFTKVNIGADTGSSLNLELSSNSFTYPGSANVTVTVTPGGEQTSTGAVQLWDGSTPLIALPLQGEGKAYWYIQPPLNIGTHQLTATYPGDAGTSPGFSSTIAVTVDPAPVSLSASCWNSAFPYGSSYTCTANLSSNTGPAIGTLSYVIDGAANSAVLSNGNAQFAIATPNAGSHSLTLSYTAQGNFAAAGPVNETFVVTPAPTQIQLTPSSYYQSTAATLTLAALLTSWSAGAPTDGTVAFYDGTVLLGILPVQATVNFTAAGLSSGMHNFSAAYMPGPSGNYAAASSAVATVQLY